jgi:hypothetical protein
MPERVYLDTNAFRYFGVAFETATLPADLTAQHEFDAELCLHHPPPIVQTLQMS